ncbi:penicillin-binding protein 1C [Candidatus Uhrbacteria bacterium RIFCSPHIGHO2_12_FULL_60_25]|uniref:peptidoglycan glycosyltransferase n=1 Tax=Candidatus Uhrbacteria bacterium RIFCSPHIGHO2_12_FULL_60_25 TaxID=1802399 RepID=A0A1F7UJ56_9BACT|nr:MAG: penicillin-binding protein 1C [Candidatus Uhrbacteria bacterium RIFCSPHIGHO2_02_FULL_60_44]OGL78299.1 MAG: penicillin-binding protein 1C [Candidatus Uhrbacteria bacterium RIFCSPHIGHO2_12_FULL_60_25]
MSRRRAVLTATIALLMGATGFVVWSISPVLSDKKPTATTKILARDGSLLYEVSLPEEGDRTNVPLSQVPIRLQQAVIATEDARFRRHRGVDVAALGRAFRDLATRGRITGGASTIEQQLVKNLYFRTKRRTVVQKMRELVAASYWSFTHTKDDTLERYLNTVPLGGQAYGVAAAARTYFRKDIGDVTLPEAALLAGIISSPGSAEPYAHGAVAEKARSHALDRMVAEGFISNGDADDARANVVTVFAPRHPIKAPHFVFQVLNELEGAIPGIRDGGYEVRTTLDPDLQRTAEDVISSRLETLKDQNAGNAALVAADARSGDVLAYVGSADYFNDDIQGRVDMVQAKRQPGSALKPFLYIAALMNGWTAASVIPDLPVRFETQDGNGYYPKNYSHTYSGPVSIRDALGSSLNIPAVRVLHDLGLVPFFDTLRRFGLTFPEAPDYYGLSIVLGGGEVTLRDATQAYARLAAGARGISLRDVTEVKNAEGKIIFRAALTRPSPVYDDESSVQAAWIVSDILKDRLARSRSFGEANLLDVGKRVAVKTGTTRDFHDNWAFGYTPDFALGVWVGNADGRPMQGVSGITGAVPIWHDVMMLRLADVQEVTWPEAAGLVRKDVCVTSGLLANGTCPKTRVERFIAGTEPSRPDDWYKIFRVDAASGRLADESCPSRVVERTYLVPPPEYSAWFAATRYERPPDTDCSGRTTGQRDGQVMILSPLDGDRFEVSDRMAALNQSIPFIAGGSATAYRWRLNGQALESDEPTYLWTPSPGEYTLQLEGADRQVRFTVK